jgi:2-polyprenyl-3-methyl-5-hydroxy-6-metoxy-1,4-benzoquinol methylase
MGFNDLISDYLVGEGGQETPRHPCRACGSDNTQLRGSKPGWTSATEYSFYDCRACGLLFVEPFAGFEVYNDAYYRGEGPDPFVDYESEYRDWRSTDRRIELNDCVRIAEHYLRRTLADSGVTAEGSTRSSPNSELGRPVRWLDFGCGAGALLKCLRDRGEIAGRPIKIVGHDVGSYAEALSSVDHFQILAIDALNQQPDESYDVISMIEVIEHLPAPAEQINLISRLLKPGGLLLLTTGNLQSPMAKRQGIFYGYCAPEIHISLFSPQSLTKLYERAGLSSFRVKYRGVVDFKVLKTLRHRPVLKCLARLLLLLPPIRSIVDFLFGVSAMPCAIKRA